MNFTSVFYLLPLLLLLNSCAGTYKELLPSKVAYPNDRGVEAIGFTYKYDLLSARGNKKYAKKEEKKGIRVVGVKIENKTNRTLVVGEDLQLYRGNDPINLLETESIYRSLRQTPPIYLLYLLLFPAELTITVNNDITTYPLGYVLGPGLALGNMGQAAHANGRMKKELQLENLMGRAVDPGETVYGLVGVIGNNYDLLRLRLQTE